MMRNDNTNELDRLLHKVDEPKPTREKMERILEMVDRKTGLSSARKPVRTRRMSRRAWIALAVAAVLTVSLGIGSIAYAENAEYNRALAYFEENGLSTEGLTRTEIRLVYHDIATENYSYPKTAEVITISQTQGASVGYEIFTPDEPYAEELGRELDKMYDVMNSDSDNFFALDGMKVFIKDIAERDGKMYVSATAVDTGVSGSLIGLTDADGLVQLEYSEPYLNELVSAVLFVFDLTSGELLNNYEVKGANGAGITMEYGAAWTVERLVKASFTPDWNTLSAGTAAVWIYCFDANGVFISARNTGTSKASGF